MHGPRECTYCPLVDMELSKDNPITRHLAVNSDFRSSETTTTWGGRYNQYPRVHRLRERAAAGLGSCQTPCCFLAVQT